jgi:hypothetical protein
MKEYFLSEDIQQDAEASKFAIEPISANRYIAECCLLYILYYAKSDSKTTTDRDFKLFPLLQYANVYWMSHFQNGQGEDDAAVMALLYKLFLSEEKF